MQALFICPGCGKSTADYDRQGAYCNNKDCLVKQFRKSQIQDQKIIYRTKGDVYNSDWKHSDWFEWWLRNYVSDGTCLNVCCGYSNVGDVRVDINPDSSRTEACDLRSVLDKYGENAFDYVYVDPIYADYLSGKDRFGWQYDLLKVSAKQLITKRPRVNINMPSKKHYYSVLEESSPALSLLRFDVK